MCSNKPSTLNFTRMRARKWLTFLLVVLFITACQNPKTPPNNSVGITGIQVINGTQQPPATMKPFVFKTSQPDTAALKGKLIVLDPQSAPEQGGGIFLVPIDQSSPGVSTVPQFKKGEVPQAEVDERTGDLMFTNIKPGIYMVMIITVGGAQIPVHTNDAARNLIIVKVDDTYMNKTTELGKMTVP